MDKYEFKNLTGKDVKSLFKAGMKNLRKNNPESKLVHKIKNEEESCGSISYGRINTISVLEETARVLGMFPKYEKKFEIIHSTCIGKTYTVLRVYDQAKKPAVNRLVRMKYANALG